MSSQIDTQKPVLGRACPIARNRQGGDPLCPTSNVGVTATWRLFLKIIYNFLLQDLKVGSRMLDPGFCARKKMSKSYVTKTLILDFHKSFLIMFLHTTLYVQICSHEQFRFPGSSAHLVLYMFILFCTSSSHHLQVHRILYRFISSWTESSHIVQVPLHNLVEVHCHPEQFKLTRSSHLVKAHLILWCISSFTGPSHASRTGSSHLEQIHLIFYRFISS
jgi:hypothetical protein